MRGIHDAECRLGARLYEPGGTRVVRSPQDVRGVVGEMDVGVCRVVLEIAHGLERHQDASLVQHVLPDGAGTIAVVGRAKWSALWPRFELSVLKRRTGTPTSSADSKLCGSRHNASIVSVARSAYRLRFAGREWRDSE